VEMQIDTDSCYVITRTLDLLNTNQQSSNSVRDYYCAKFHITLIRFFDLRC